MARRWFVVNFICSIIGATKPSPEPITSGGNEEDALQLVLHVLPILGELITHFEEVFPLWDKRHGFLSNIHTATILLIGHLRDIEETGKANIFKAQIERLAGLLEEVFDDAIIAKAQLNLSQDMPFRRLYAVYKLVPRAEGWETKLQDVRLVSINRPSVAWDQLQDSLEELSEQLEQFEGDILIAQKPHQSKDTLDTAENSRAFAEQLHSALLCGNCQITPQREARLKIGTYKQRMHGDGAKCLCILFTRDLAQHSGYEVLLHDTQQPISTPLAKRARFLETETTTILKEEWRLGNPKYYNCICEAMKIIESQPSEISGGYRSNIVLCSAGTSFQGHMPTKRTYKKVSLQRQVTLKALLASRSDEMSEPAKMTLTLILTYSLFSLYGGSWVKDRWSRTNIVFFQDNMHISLQPFLSFDPQKRHGPLCDPDGLHQYPEFLELGVILLEIYLGQQIKKDISDYNNLWFTAWGIFQKKQSRFMSPVIRNAIKKCLRPDFFLSGRCDDQILRESLFKDIIKPIEEELKRSFTEFISLDSLDEDAGKITIDLRSQTQSIIPDYEASGTTSRSLGADMANISPSSLDIDQTLPSMGLGNKRGPLRPSSRRGFEVAIICALPLEADAVYATFDVCWDKQGTPFDKAPGDPCAYSTGAIGRHNLVLAHMPNMGKASGASIASYCRMSFPNIKLALVVGICGVVPFDSQGVERVLGDVIISDGVVQSDFGRKLPQGFVRKSSPLNNLGRPDIGLRSISAKLKLTHILKELEDSISSYLVTLQHETHLAAQYPGKIYDKLFEVHYTHADQNQTCEQLACDGNLLQRSRLQTQSNPQPAIHFGLLASGDSVIKNGEERDKIARKEGIIAFEMESVGVWDHLPCLVIKGACDYADSHKNKIWQRYAAATAAACAKAFLGYWVPSQSI